MGYREFEIAGKTLTVFELDDVSNSATARPLTGSWIWDSALVLTEWMAEQAQLDFTFQDKTVIELGAGVGLPGLAAALLGAKRVVLTDIETLLPGLVRNVEANGFGDRVEVRELVWGSDESEVSGLGELGGEFDLVLMSDVFFDAEEMAALSKTMKKVCGKKTRIWAASEVRPWTVECLNELTKEGFGLVELPREVGKVRSSSLLLGNESFLELDSFAIFRLKPPNQKDDGHVTAVDHACPKIEEEEAEDRLCF
ncbi:uncharacterized protein LOC125418865 [Ziziphus jujuba]|uniref:Uncharacterized protein LOC125418865 n=1 Tax=Ziziphus jujuba TaxID=326968 RepID=A0ABM3I2X3_ZIZJJ|nr:uncharacterized protein LOC125418865 [Ziziphus jujuba]